MELQVFQTEEQQRHFSDLHLEWLTTNNLNTKLYQTCLEEGIAPDRIKLERSVKIDAKTLEVVSQQRYVVCDTKPSIQSTKNLIDSCSNTFTTKPKDFVSGFNVIYRPSENYQLYVGVDNNDFKAGMDYINKCLLGIAFIGGQCYYRKYTLHKDSSWYQQLIDYINLYRNNINSLVAKAYITAMNKCRSDQTHDVYIKHDENGLVFHMDTRHFKIPQFDVLLRTSSTFAEKFTWISINDRLDKLTLYMRPVFNKS